VSIAKIDKAEQMVWGYASTPTLDLDNEKVSLAAIKGALPGYLEWSNIREMHQPSAVGVARETSVDEKGLWLGAHITDPTAWQKCVDRVYKGFSIGGTILAKSGNVIDEIELIEISLVDRPANPECRIEIVKSARLVADQGAELVPVAEDDQASFVGRAVAKAMQILGASRARSRGEDFEKSAEEPIPPVVLAALPEPTVPAIAPSQVDSTRDEDYWDLSKGMCDIHNLVSAFDRLRDVQRTRMLEGRLEGDDPVDAAASAEAGSLAEGIASLIAQIAMGERAEASSMTDVDDMMFMQNAAWMLSNNPSESYEMSAGTSDLAKRASAAFKEHAAKGAHHLGKASSCQKEAGTALQELSTLLKDHAKTGKAASTAGTSLPVFPADQAMELIRKAFSANSQVEDHLEIGSHHLVKMATEVDFPDWSGKPSPVAGPMGMGDPLPSAVGPTPGHESGKGAGLSQEVVDQMIALATKAAHAEGKLEALSRMPGGPIRGRTFEIGKAAGVPEGQAGAKPMELLMDGVDLRDDSLDSQAKAAGKMIGNMIKNSRTFAKDPMTDPNFRGMAG
jgi:hypothetical protein